jgi:hypothetical protein
MDIAGLFDLASERIALPDGVTMRFDYQDDVDTLCIRFKGDVSSSLVSKTDETESGVIGIYEGKKLVGLEILDITGQLEYANPI